MKKSVKQELNKILKEHNYKNINEIDWNCISHYQKLSEDFIREYKDKVNWVYISHYQQLSEDFIKEFKDKVEWRWISEFQQFSEDFIREFQDKIRWCDISRYQELSFKFISEFRNKLDLDKLLERKLITQENINKIYRPVNRFELIDI